MSIKRKHMLSKGIMKLYFYFLFFFYNNFKISLQQFFFSFLIIFFQNNAKNVFLTTLALESPRISRPQVAFERPNKTNVHFIIARCVLWNSLMVECVRQPGRTGHYQMQEKNYTFGLRYADIWLGCLSHSNYGTIGYIILGIICRVIRDCFTQLRDGQWTLQFSIRTDRQSFRADCRINICSLSVAKNTLLLGATQLGQCFTHYLCLFINVRTRSLSTKYRHLW